MMTVLGEIAQLREGKAMVIDYKNSNRYRVVFREADGSRTAYYFSTPIYNLQTRKTVDLKFHKNGSSAIAAGSNASIMVSDEIRLENQEGFCLMSLEEKLSGITEHELYCGSDSILPTTNGVVYKARSRKISFELKACRPYIDIRANDKSFSLMSEVYRPFVTVSCIGTAHSSGEIIAPARLSYQKKNDCQYSLTVTPCSALGDYVMIEANLYEPKLVQDTTVESLNPKINNAFGSTAFIGYTEEFGEQWLYSRPDISKISDLIDKRIIKVIFHLPKHNRTDVELSAFKATARFCSFGSNWDNKIAASGMVAHSVTRGKYQSLDITELLTDGNTGYFTLTEGMVLKTKEKGKERSVIGTGDSYYSPQIMEINWR